MINQEILKGRSRYEKKNILGEGSYGVVYRAYDKVKRMDVAIKKIHLGSMNNRMERGVDVSAIREIKVLREIRHENIVELVDVFVRKSNLHLVYELLEIDLREYMKRKTHHYTEQDIKCILFQILKGVEKLHECMVIHRDLKPDNILMAQGKHIKISDFGLAKTFGNRNIKYSPQACTIWYRAPELLFGSEWYGPTVDMWSIGCVFGELLLRNPLFPSLGTELNQLAQIFSFIGTPNETNWPDCKKLPLYCEFTECHPVPPASVFSAASREAVDLISKMLILDPNRRITVKQALEHDFFTREPRMTIFDQLQLPKEKMERSDRVLLQGEPSLPIPFFGGGIQMGQQQQQQQQEEEEEEENVGISKSLF